MKDILKIHQIWFLWNVNPNFHCFCLKIPKFLKLIRNKEEYKKEGKPKNKGTKCQVDKKREGKKCMQLMNGSMYMALPCECGGEYNYNPFFQVPSIIPFVAQHLK